MDSISEAIGGYVPTEQVTFKAAEDIFQAGNSTQPNVQTGTSYTVSRTDWGRTITLNNVGAITVTLPAGLPAGFWCQMIQLGAGQVTLQAGAGATLNALTGALRLSGQYAGCTVLWVSANRFVATGSLI
jgi:hypothetical protein